MNRLVCLLLLCSISAALMFAAGQPPASASKVFDSQLKMLESEFVPLAEAMPAEKYNFAPTDGEFTGVRTFAQQVSHTAAVIYIVSAALLREKNPSEAGPGENGPANLKTKDDIVKYLKDSIAYGHKAIGTLTDKNLLEQIPSPFDPKSTSSRVGTASIIAWHSFDHYGQMVVYARMNGIVPPASRK
jgi:hypothetical protein